MTESEEEITDFDSDVKTRSMSSAKRKQRAISKSMVVAPETISLSSALKRGLKLGPSDDAEGRSLSNTLRRELKSSVSNLAGSLPRGATLQPKHVDEPPPSPRPGGNKFFSVRKNRKSDESIPPKSPRGKSIRPPREPKKGDYACDDSISMLEAVLVDNQGIRYEEGIRDTIGRKMKVTLKKMVKLEKSQGGVAEMKVLTLTPDRCFILGVKSPFKIEVSFHFLDMKSIDSPTTERLTISTTNGKIYFFQMIGSDDADQIIGRLALSLRKTFPGVSLSKIVKASLEPLHRQKIIQSMLNQADMMESGPCGNFSEMYQCMCNHLGLPVREEVGWDVDTIYLSQNCKDLNLKDFDLPDLKDYMPILSVLMYNRWFDGLTVRNIKLPNDVFDVILKVVKCSAHLKSLILDGVGLKGETALKLSQELVDNKESRINVLDLSNNPLEDRAIMHLSGSLTGLRQGGGLQVLKFDRTGLTAKGVSGMCQSLRSSVIITKTLTSLTLSDNVIKGDEAGGLYNYLSKPNNLEHLDMSGTDCAVEIYVSAMSKGCLEKLKTINLSRNFFYGKKNKENALPNTFQQYFKTTKALASIDLSGMKVPHEAVKQLMDGLRQNFTEGLEVSVNLSNAEIRSQGAQVIGAVIGQLSNLVGLDLTDNGLDADLAKLLAWVQQNKSLRELKIGKNFSGVKPKHMRAVIDSIVELVQEEGSCLESLHLNDSKLKDWATIILGCLGSNTSLTTLDISGNLIGDSGARVLAKALQINSKIRVLLMDKNSFTANGFHEIATALEKNYSLRYLPYPVNDAVTSMKSQPDRTQASLAKIQDLLLRNANINKNSNDQQFRLQQAVASTAQEVLDKVAEKVDNTVNALDLLEDPTSCPEVVVKAKGLVKDANMSKRLLSDIYGLGMEMTAGDHSNLKLKLDEMARDMDAMVQEHVKNTVGAMTKSAESQCPHIFQDILRDVEGKTADKSTFPKDFVKDRVITEASKEIINKVSELNLAVATLISEKVADTLLTALSQCNTTLTEQLKKKKAEQAAAREKIYLKNENESKAKKAASEKPTPVVDDVAAEPVAAEASKEEEKPATTENILPAMRKARAASIARRKQRPNQALDLEAKKKVDEEPTPPRPATPIQESVSSDEEAPPDRSPEEVKITTQKEVIEKKEDIKEDVPVKEEPPKETAVEEKSEEIPEPEEKEEEVSSEEPPKKDIIPDIKEDSEMVAGDSVKEMKADDIHDGGVSADELDFLPELPTATRKLEHLAKGRPRPVRRMQKKPVAKDVETDQSVDDFFTASVTSTDFDKVPTWEEQEKESEKEKTPRKPRGFGLPGMAQITPDMLKKRRQNSGNSDKEETKEDDKSSNDKDDHKSKNGEEAEPETVTKRRPPGAMGLPGMGFGGNVLAEMKLKKLNKKSMNPESAENGKPDTEPSPPRPFGRSMLKKTIRSPTSPTEKKEDVNSNNNNNKAAPKLSTNKWKSKSFDKAERPDLTPKTALSKGPPPLPRKPNPPPLSAKPGKGSPPPLPSKPKPTARPDSVSRGARSRPVSEFVDPKRVPTSVKDRAALWKKEPKKYRLTKQS